MTRSTRRLQPEDIATNQHIGNRIAMRRYQKAVTQQELGETIGGITAQALSKLEKGRSTISATKIWQIARQLDTPVEFFYEGLESVSSAAGASPKAPTDVMTPSNVEAIERLSVLDSDERAAIERLLYVMTRDRLA